MTLTNPAFSVRSGKRYWSPARQRGVALAVRVSKGLYEVDGTGVFSVTNEGDTGRNLVQSTVANRPTISTLGANAVPCLLFNDSTDQLDSVAHAYHWKWMHGPTAAVTIYVVYETVAGVSTILSTQSTEVVGEVGVTLRNESNGDLTLELSNGSAYLLDETVAPADGIHVVCVRWDYPNDLYSIRVDGVEVDAGSFSAGTPSSANPDRTLLVGNQTTVARKLAELAIVRGWDLDDVVEEVESALLEMYEGTGTEHGYIPTSWTIEGNVRSVRSAVYVDADWTPVQTGAAIPLPNWLELSCPTAGRTAQSADNAIVSGYAANAARPVSRDDGDTWGLLIEPAMANLVTDDDLSNWITTNTPVVSSTTLPDGNSGNNSLEDADGALLEGVDLGITPTVDGDHTLSAWTWLVATSSSAGIYLSDTGVTDSPVITPTVDSDWVFRDETASITTDWDQVRIFPAFSGTGTIRVSFIQTEQRSYPTSWHASSREPDILRVSATQDLASDGYIDAFIDFAPNWAVGEESGDANLIWIDDDNRVYFRSSDAKIVVRYGGSDVVESSALTWSRYQRITVKFHHTVSTMSLIVAGASSGNGTTTYATAVAPPTITSTSSIFLFGDSSGATEAFDVHRVDFGGQISDVEAFNWNGNLVASFDTTDYTFALYASGTLVTAVPYDNFESTNGWDSTYQTTIGSSEAATFDSGGPAGETVEDFEESWDGTTSAMVYETTISSSTTADYNSSAGTTETFEAGSGEGWDTAWVNTMGSTTAASFDSGGTPEAFEDFEEVSLRVQVTVNITSNVFTTFDGGAHGFTAPTDIITFEGDGLPDGLQSDIEYTVATTPSASTFTAGDPDGVTVDVISHPTAKLYVVPDQTAFWVHGLE